MDDATSYNHYLYNKDLRPLAGALRKNMTKAEACLWKHVLRAGMMKGYTFNRQRPVITYIADFFCKRLRLVVEVDGITHGQEETCRKDRKKEEDLEKAGFKVVRFTDEEVLTSIEGVRKALESCIEERQKALGIAPHIPLTEGDRGGSRMQTWRGRSSDSRKLTRFSIASPIPPHRGGQKGEEDSNTAYG